MHLGMAEIEVGCCPWEERKEGSSESRGETWHSVRAGVCWHSLVRDGLGSIWFCSEVFIPLFFRGLCRVTDLKYYM